MGIVRARVEGRLSAFRLTVVGLLFAATGIPIQAATSPVGTTPGSHQVTPTGAFTYTIPIAVPPGTAGMQPNLSLSYNSQGGNGLLGMGWSLSGLSVIHRCARTLVQDGAKGGINLNANDRYCLDGQRLVAIAGAYGAANTEYRTETESYSRIISYGSQGSGPAYWKVWSKSGQIMEYGVSNDSRIEAQGKTDVRLWALNKVQDTVGNYLTVTYLEDNASGQYYPTKIDYAGNASTGKAPTNSVQFIYEARPDITSMYQAGSLIKSAVRMTKAQSYAGALLTREYRIAYSQSPTTQRSLVGSLTECAGDGVCLPSEGFQWQAETNGFVGALPDNTMGFQQWSRYGWNPGSRPHEIVDMNGDGLPDVVSFQADGLYVWLSTGSGFVGAQADKSMGFQQWSVYNWDPGSRPHGIADMNGDGLPDIISFQADGLYVWLSTGSGFVGALPDKTMGFQQWSVYNWSPGSRPHEIADMNGDGLSDVVSFQADGLYVWLSTGGGFVGAQPGNTMGFQQWSVYNWSPGSRPHEIVDMNGDGLSDIISFQADGLYVWLSTGSGFAGALPGNTMGFQQWSVYNWDPGSRPHGIADMNGDGLLDIISFQADGLYVWLSTGSGFVGVLPGNTMGFQQWSVYNWSPGSRPHQAADMTGDGKADVVSFQDDGLYVWPTNPGHSTMAMVTTGLGATTTVTYKPLTDNSIYSKGTGATRPYIDLQPPMYVASQVSTSDGLGGSYAMDYTYAGAKAHVQGGGFLGFRQVTARDPQAGIRTTTTYRQDYPYHGLPLSVQKVTDSLVPLNQVTNTYSDLLINVALSPVYHRALLAQSVESSYELTGGLVTTVTTQTQYDTYGNPTQIVVSTGDGYSKTTSNSYDNIIDSNRWFLGRLRRSSVTSVTP